MSRHTENHSFIKNWVLFSSLSRALLLAHFFSFLEQVNLDKYNEMASNETANFGTCMRNSDSLMLSCLYTSVHLMKMELVTLGAPLRQPSAESIGNIRLYPRVDKIKLYYLPSRKDLLFHVHVEISDFWLWLPRRSVSPLSEGMKVKTWFLLTLHLSVTSVYTNNIRIVYLEFR